MGTRSNATAARPLNTCHEVVRKSLFERDLEVRCLAVTCTSVNTLTEFIFYMDKRSKHGIQEYMLVSKVYAFKAERFGHFQSSWREYYVRPRGDCQCLDCLGEAPNFDFIAEGGCLYNSGEVDCIARSFHEGLVIQWVKHRLEESFDRRRKTIISKFPAWNHKSERPQDIVEPLITEHLTDDAPGKSSPSRSPTLTLTQADFDKLDEFVEELNVWGNLLPFWPSDLSLDKAPQATAEVSHSMESERQNSSNGSPTTDHLLNERPQDDLQPLSLTPTISQADLDQFDQFIEDWYGSRARFQLPHWSDGEAA